MVLEAFCFWNVCASVHDRILFFKKTACEIFAKFTTVVGAAGHKDEPIRF